VIPFEFSADSSKIGGAGVRLIVAKADRRLSFRQMILERRLIKPVWTYVMGDAINRGLLPPIEGWWKIILFTDFRLDLLRFLENNRELLETAELGLFAVVPPDPSVPISQLGIIFCLRQRDNKRPTEVNPLAPYYLVYVLDDGNVRLTFMQPKQALDLFRCLAANHASAFTDLCDSFDARNANGSDMSHESRLLDSAMESIKSTFARRATSSLLSGREGLLPMASETPTSSDDMELITWLVVLNSKS
jgi:hypothetical protein